MADLLHALIIEDSESDAELIRHYLNKDGFELVSERVETLAGVKAALKKPGWEVIISDYNLPGFNAAAALAALQKTGKDIPFIIVSGKIEEETAIELMRTGAADYLMKDKLARLAPVVRRELLEAQSRQERREAEEALKKSEFRYKLLFDYSPFGVVIIDPETTLPINFNAVAHQQLGYSREEFYKTPIRTFEAIESQQDIKARIKRLLIEGRDEFDTLHRTKQGEIRSIHVILQILDIEGKKLQHCIFQDITERKQAEAALKESESTLEDIFQSVNEGIAYATLSGEVLAVNNALIQILDIPRNEMVGRNITTIAKKLLSIKIFPQITPILYKIINGDSVPPFEVKYKNKILEVCSIYNKDARHITGVIHDITERKQAEIMLQESKDQFQQIVERSNDVFYRQNIKTGLFEYVSPKVYEMLGYTTEEFERLDFDGQKNNTHPDDLPHLHNFVTDLIEADTRGKKFVTRKFRLKNRQGEYRWIHGNYTLLREVDSSPHLIVGSLKDITEEVLANQALQESEARLQVMVTNISDVIAIMKADGIIIYTSPNIKKWFGWEPDDLIGTNGWDTVHPDDLERTQAAFHNFIKVDGSTDSIEYRYKCKDGSYRLIKLTATNLIDHPVINGVLMNYHDITERRQAEIALQTTEEKFRKAFLTSPDSVNINRLSDGMYFDINDGFLALTGYTPEEVVEKTSQEINIWANPEDRKRLVEGLRAYGKVTNLEAPFRVKDGGIKICLMSANIIEVNGETCILSITRDITDWKKAEEDIQLQSAALNAVANAVVISEASTYNIKWANPAFFELSGYSKEEALGQNLADLVRSGAHNQAVYDNLWQTITSGNIWQGEIINRRKNGENYPEEMTVTPLIGKDGKITHFISVKQDITEKKLNADVMKSRLHLLEYAEDHSSEEVLQETLAEAETLTGSLIGFYHFVDSDQQTLTLQAWSRRTEQGFCKTEESKAHYPISISGIWADCIRERKPVIHNDYASLTTRKGQPEGHAVVLRELVVPVFRGGKIVAVLGVGNKPTEYREKDIEIITRLADLAWDIADKRINEIALQESENRYRDLFENSAVPTWVEDFSEVNKIFKEIRAAGVTDMRGYFEEHFDEVMRCAECVKVLQINKAGLQYYRVSSVDELGPSLPASFNEKSWPVFCEEIITLAEGGTHFVGDMTILNLEKEERLLSINLSVDPGHIQNLSRVMVSFMDITDRKIAEDQNRAERELLQICNYAGSGPELLHKLLHFFKNFTGCEAVGIRLQENGDYPYFETSGFPESFVKLENSLCEFNDKGEAIRDRSDNPLLECMCGNILCGRFNPEKDFFTEHGSFWSGNTSRLLSSTTDADRLAPTRNRCNGEGYESVALIPIRMKEKTFGLFQFNDKRIGVHTLEKIELLERLVDYVAIALAKQETDTALMQSEQSFREIFNSTSEAIFIDDAETGQMIDVNDTMLKIYGYDSKEEVLTGTIGNLSANEVPYTNDRASELVMKAIREGPQVFEWLAKRKDGSTFWSEVSLTRSQIGGKNRVLAVVRDITERKKAEEVVLESKIKLENAQHYAHIGSWTWDLKTGKLEWSNEMFHIFGVDRAAFSGKLEEIINQSIHPDDREKVEASNRSVLQEGKPIPLEYRIVLPDGSIRTVWAEAGEMQVDEPGNPSKLSGIVQDITERKLVEEKIALQVAQMDLAQKIAKIGYWSFDIATGIPVWSNMMFVVLGRDPSKGVPGFAQHSDFIHPDDWQSFEQGVQGAVNGTPYDLILRVIFPDESIHYVATQGYPQFTAGGTITSLFGISQDITDRKKAEEALLDAKWRLENIIEGTRTGTWEWNVQTGEMVFNKVLGQLLGYSLDELSPISIATWNSLTHPDDLKLSTELLERHFSGKLPYYACECRMKHKDGQWIWVHDRGRVITRTEDGKPLMMFGTHTDITERKLAEKALRESEERFHSVIEAAPTGVFLMVNGLYDYANPAGLKIMGYDNLEEFIGINMINTIHPDSRSMVLRRLDTIKPGSGNPPVEMKVLKKNGETVFTESISTSITLNGEPAVLVLSQDITDRKKAEEALRKSEALLNEAQRLSKIGAWEWDVEAQTLNWSDEVFRIHGMVHDEVTSHSNELVQRSLACYHPEDRPLIATAYNLCVTTGKPYDLDLRFISEQGEHKWVRTVGKSVFENEKVVRVSGNIMDITEQKLAEEKLQENSNQYRAIISTSSDGFFICDQDGRIQDINEEFSQMLGYPKHEILQFTLADFEASETPEEITEHIKTGIASGSNRFESCYRCQDGHIIEVEVSSTFMSSRGVFLVFVRDITARKQAEEALRKSEDRFRTLTELLPVGVYLTDREGSCQFANKKWLKIAGLTFEESLGTGWSMGLHPDDRGKVLSAWNKMVASRGEWGMEYRFMTPEGEVTWVYGLATALETEKGEVFGYVGANMDITERKYMEDSLQASLEEKEVLLREIHHRVKNNLASILGLLEMERQSTTNPAADTLLMELGNRIKSMVTIHEKLYRSPSLSKIDFQDYLTSFLSHLRTSMLPSGDVVTVVKAPQVELSLDLAVPCGLIVNELVTNALKYGFPQGKPGVPGAENCEICVCMSVKDTAYTLTVTDNGVGLPADLDWRNAKTLGLRLIAMLGEHQLGGKIMLDRTAGTKFTLKFDPRHRE
jgi:PAS domain S-box-containing protein